MSYEPVLSSTAPEGHEAESLAVFNILVAGKGDLDAPTRTRVAEVVTELMERVRAKQAEDPDWKQTRRAQAGVQQVVYDFLWDERTGLPVAAFTDEQVEQLWTNVYAHVWEQGRPSPAH